MKIRTVIFVTVGFLFVGLGTLGIFLPILPTTPFYLLAVACFAKGSPFFHNWFTNTTVYKKHLENYVHSRSMTLKTKLGILVPVSIVLLFVVLMTDILSMRIVIIGLLLIKYWYFIFMIKTVKSCDDKLSLRE